MVKPAVLITGAGGYIGSEVLIQLARVSDKIERIVAVDIREIAVEKRFPEVTYLQEDVRSPKIAELCRYYQIDIVVHLAGIVAPGPDSNRDFEYSVDVLGTRNLLNACLRSGVGKFILMSSGAAYGYYPDNPPLLSETDPLRGNEEIAYAYHKRLVEQMMARYRQQHPDLRQLIFRPATVMGKNADNLITSLFTKKTLLGVRGSQSPLAFIWDQDVAACVVEGIMTDKTGIYNLAGDDTVTLPEIAELLERPFYALPTELFKSSLWVLKKLRFSQYGPEQVDVLRYSPVLSNQKLKEEFGYTPRLTSAEVFEHYFEEWQKGEVVISTP